MVCANFEQADKLKLVTVHSPLPTEKSRHLGESFPRGGVVLFVILCAGGDGFGAVELFQSHDTHKVVGESHGTEG